MTKLFTKKNAWDGGFYGLEIELPDCSVDEAYKARACLWQSDALEGCYLRNDLEPHQQLRVPSEKTELSGHHYGIAFFPNGRKSVFGCYWGNYDEYGCWLCFYVPMGSLANVYPVDAYPFESNSSPEIWVRNVNEWFKTIAEKVYEQVRFSVAFIGFEVEGLDGKEQLKKGIPSERWHGILIGKNGGLLWYPPTIYEAPCTFNGPDG